MKTKVKGLEAITLSFPKIFLRGGGARFFWFMEVDSFRCSPVRTYATKRGAKQAAYRFAKKLGISMESVEVSNER